MRAVQAQELKPKDRCVLQDVREEALEAREEEIERQAEAELWRLIDRAIRGGLALPAR